MHSTPQLFTTPVLFLVFNRVDTTARVFEAIRKIRPAKLYVAADGPRDGIYGEFEKCCMVRSIATNVDWDCEVKTLFRHENLGCGVAVSSAITWFFEHETEGIILEDDTLPSEQFFQYCSQLLERYRDDQRVMQIGGVNLLPRSYPKNAYSYHFSYHNNIWGWGTWKRAWDLYDFKIKRYEVKRSLKHLRQDFASVHEDDYFSFVFERTSILPNITWDYQWEFVRRINSGLTIVPNVNLVVNLGFGHDATNTAGHGGPATELRLEKMTLPLKHPEAIVVDRNADRAFFIHCLTTPPSRLKSHIKSLLPRSVRERLLKSAIKRYVDAYKQKMTAHQKRIVSSLGKAFSLVAGFDVEVDVVYLMSCVCI